MSNFLAVATVTATLKRILQAALDADEPGNVGGAVVTTARPDALGKGELQRGVNIYLYQVAPNASLRNLDLPTRNGDGDVVQRPRAAVDLHYLLSFYGEETTLEPQRLLGLVVRTLHARPVLTRPMVQATVADGGFSYIADSNLHQDDGPIRFTPLNLSLEELSKLWSVFFQTAYHLSVAYQATVVLLEGRDTPRSALPVRSRNVYVLPFRSPTIERVVSDEDPLGPLVASSTLRIEGRGFGADVVRLRLRGVEATPTEVHDTRILLPLPMLNPAEVRAGVQALQVLQPTLMGTPPTEHRGFESNVAAVVIRPTVDAVGVSNVTGSGTDPRSATITIDVTPALAVGQRASLLLNANTPNAPAAYRFDLQPSTVNAPTIPFDVDGVAAGDYFVRLQVDGAESPWSDLTPHAVIP